MNDYFHVGARRSLKKIGEDRDEDVNSMVRVSLGWLRGPDTYRIGNCSQSRFAASWFIAYMNTTDLGACQQ